MPPQLEFYLSVVAEAVQFYHRSGNIKEFTFWFKLQLALNTIVKEK